MGFFGRFAPVRAYRDLRLFLSQRQPYELGFLVLAMVITGVFVYAFVHDNDSIHPEYKRDIIYVEQWPANRTDAEIIAQQKIDAPIKAARLAEEKRLEDKRRAEFKKVDDAMTAWGM